MTAQLETEYGLRQGSMKIAQLVGEPQEQVEADWIGPFLRRSQSNEANNCPCHSGTPKLHRSSSHNILRNEGTGSQGSSLKAPKLKLPSFDELGISGLGKDLRFGHSPEDYFRRCSSRPVMSTRPSLSYGLGSTPLLTPPEDVDSLKWNRAVSQGNHAQQENMITTPNRIPSLFTLPLTSHTQPSRDSSSSFRPSQSENERLSVTHSNQPPQGTEINEGDDWLEKAIRKTVGSSTSSETLGQSIKIVSQAMPCPSDQASQPGSVFPVIVNEISNRYSSSTPNIEVFHAVPLDFSLRNLPTSPPTTPNTSIGGDYFSQVFGSATPIQPHHNHNGVLVTRPPSTSTFVRPRSSVSFSILERLIPPASAKEYTDLFGTQNSALADRMIELSPQGGSIIFICPTKSGAESFRDELLGPILDPLLRNLISLNSLYTDLGSSLGRLMSVSAMFDFPKMVKKLTELCHTLSRQTYSADTRSRFEFLYAGKGKTILPREIWSELFIKQERPRMRELLDGYWSRGRRLPRNTEVTSATMLREIIDGLDRRPYEESEPREEMEVGVFVIRRTLA